MQTKKRRHPIFDLLDERGVRYSWLALKLGYNKRSVYNIAARVFEPGPKFRRKCAELLGLPESELFLSAEANPPTESLSTENLESNELHTGARQ
jgi:hypothetical protein